MAPDSPIGLFIKGRRLKPFFYAATIATPLLSHIIILAIDYQWKEVLYVAAMFWGLAYTCIQIAALPYILLNARQETHSEAISMSFLSFSVTICLVGVANFLLNQDEGGAAWIAFNRDPDAAPAGARGRREGRRTRG